MRKTLFIGLVSVVSATAFAQMDNVVEVENNYRPVVKDANKINSLPEIEQPQVSHYNVNYTTVAIPTTNYVFQPMWAAKNEQLIRSDKKGFATAAYGIDNNVLGRVAYGLDLSANDELNFEFYSRGHNSEADHILGNQKWDNRYFTNRLKAGYEHRFGTDATLSIKGGYGSDVFNYQTRTVPAGKTDKQHNDLLELSAELTPYSFGKFGIGAAAEINTFRQKYATNFTEGVAETLIGVTLTPEYQFDESMKVDVDVAYNHTGYNIDDMIGKLEGYDAFYASPHFYWSNDQIDLMAGLYISDELKVAPDVEAVYHTDSWFDLYAQAKGGETYNSFRHFTEMTPYWYLPATIHEIDDQFDQLNARGGIRMKPFEGFYADLSLGYDISENRAEIADFDMSPTLNYIYAPIMFADGTHFYVNADLRYNYRNKIMASLDASYHKWSTDFDASSYVGVNTKNWDKITWRPQIELGCNVMVKPIEQLTIGADFLFESYPKLTNRYERPNTVNVGATISYTFPFRLTLYAKGDNLLNKKYDQYVMYRTPGINFLAGAAITF
jgi:hypothetical protein